MHIAEEEDTRKKHQEAMTKRVYPIFWLAGKYGKVPIQEDTMSSYLLWSTSRMKLHEMTSAE